VLPRDWSRWCEHIRNKTAFYIRDIYQWDDVDLLDLDRWIRNFTDSEGKYLAMRLLNRFIYYSERDVKRLLEHGIFKVLLYRDSVGWSRDSQFLMSDDQQQNLASQLLQNTTFTPLLDRNKPSESGPVLCRYLNRDVGIPSAQICQPSDLASKHDTKIVILDDFIGSGQQVIDFWNEPKINQSRLSELAVTNNLEVACLCLVGTRYGLQRVAAQAKGLRVLTCEVLEEHHRVFHKPSLFFGQASEVQAAKRYLERLCASRQLKLTGFHNLDYALAFHHAIPDASLPLFYESTDNWWPLVKRRSA